MKGLSAGLIFFSVTTVVAVLLGLGLSGLGFMSALVATDCGLIAALLAYLGTFDPGSDPGARPDSRWKFGSIPFWFVTGCFVIFAVRSFCWLLYIDGGEFKIQSTNNLGDLALHITYIKTFANGIPLWPDNPIFVFSKLRYPVGVDLFNGLLLLLHINLIRGLAWVGILASLGTFYAFYRWGRTFSVAGFLFNGGIVGFAFLHGFEWKDYQGVNTIAWKSIPLAMFVTQRGLLYAIPAGLLLLWHWRRKFFGADFVTSDIVARGGDPGSETPCGRSHRSEPDWHSGLQPGPLPFWVEVTLYGSLPLFHVHTFLALTVVLVCMFVFGHPLMRAHIATVLVTAFVPATFFVWLITDHFHARSMLKWQPGWVQSLGDFAHPFSSEGPSENSGFFEQANRLFQFWFGNFGVAGPLVLFYIGVLGWRAWQRRTKEKIPMAIPLEVVPVFLTIVVMALAAPSFRSWWSLLYLPAIAAFPTAWVFTKARNYRLPIDMPLAFTIPAIALFLFGYLYKTAPWEWDNLKLMFWGYFLILPFLWKDLIAKWPLPFRIVTCVMLFGSGFFTLFGGLATPGYGFANRAEVAEVGVAVRTLPADAGFTARFAAYPTYNHPLLLQGCKVVLGYPGHLWTQGFDYHLEEAKLRELMQGQIGWRQAAKALRVRYIFWGREERTNYPTSLRPWERELAKVASGPWGAIYDLQQPATAP